MQALASAACAALRSSYQARSRISGQDLFHFFHRRHFNLANAFGADLVFGRQVMQRDGAAAFDQRVPRRQHDAVAPAVAGQRDQLGVTGQRFGGHTDVGIAREQHLGHLLGRALVQVQRDARVALAEVAHHVRQRVTRLRVRGRNRQAPLVAALQFLAGAAQALGVQQHALDDGQQGIIDFQDALVGHPAYDLVSLLQDARRDVRPELEADMLAYYLTAANPGPDFDAHYALLGAQRNTKIIGIFTRLWKRDGKERYLSFLPRMWGLLERDLAHPALANVKQWFDTHIPTEVRSLSPLDITHG